MKKMTKQEIIEHLVENTGLRRSDAKKAVDGVIEALAQAFAKGENVYLRCFGTFKVQQVKEKKDVSSPREKQSLYLNIRR